MKHIVTLIAAIVLTTGCARTTATYNSPDFGSISYSSTKNVKVVKQIIKPDGTQEYLMLVGDAASVETARGQNISGYISGAESIALQAAQLYLQPQAAVRPQVPVQQQLVPSPYDAPTFPQD